MNNQTPTVRPVVVTTRGPAPNGLPPPNVAARVLNHYIPDFLANVDEAVIEVFFGHMDAINRGEGTIGTHDRIITLGGQEDRRANDTFNDFKNYVKTRMQQALASHMVMINRNQ